MRLTARWTLWSGRIDGGGGRGGGRGRGGGGGRLCRSYSGAVGDATRPPFRVAIIGSGPAGFYSAKRLLSLVDEATVDMYEQLPVPFGLVRYGVAPDHPEVKNCQDTFGVVAESARFRFIGHVQVGAQLPVQNLLPHYDALLFAYGASQDRELGLGGEDRGGHVYSARAFVGWYNGLPEYRDLDPDLRAGEDAVIVGQGNVALDVARILLTDVDVLRRTDMTDYALEKLAESRIRNVRIVGRRGPVQAAFTIKEIREMLHLPNTSFKPIPDSLFPAELKSLPRPQRRILDLLKKASSSSSSSSSASAKSWSLEFLLSPQSLHFSSSNPDRLSHISFSRNVLADPSSPRSPLLQADPTTPSPAFSIQASTLFRSIGYKSAPLPATATIPFDRATGTFVHDRAGRIVLPAAKRSQTRPPKPALYCAGWVKTGPTGVIASTMADAFATAEAMAADWRSSNDDNNSSDTHKHTSPSHGTTSDGNKAAETRSAAATTTGGWHSVRRQAEADGIQLRPVSWQGWRRIDRAERARAGRISKASTTISASHGRGHDCRGRGIVQTKPREKLTRVADMLALSGSESRSR